MAESNVARELEFNEDVYNDQMEVLNEHRSFLCRTIQPSRHYPYLRQEQVLSLAGQETIESQVTTAGKVNKLIDELEQNGGSKAYLAFIKSLLREKTQDHVIRKLNMALEAKRNRPNVRDGINQNHAHLRKEPTEDDDIDIILSVEDPVEPDKPKFTPPQPPSFEKLLTTRGSSNPHVNGHNLIPHGIVEDANSD